VTTSATAGRQPATPGWRRVGRSLVRELSFRDFDEAFGFVQRIANEAVDYMRRPDICIFSFNRVRLTIANPHHAGLTEAELRVARRVDAMLTAEPSFEQSASCGSGRAAADGRAWIVPATRSARSSRTTSARRVVDQISAAR
jgi:4a-hydroxytetrahydrobiopterin dehydratase